jgi:hypothetical protein
MNSTNIVTAAASAVEVSLLSAQIAKLSSNIASIKEKLEEVNKGVNEVKIKELILAQLSRQEQSSVGPQIYVAHRSYYNGEYGSWEVQTKEEFLAGESYSDHVYVIVTVDGDDVTFSEESSNVPFQD